MKDILVLLLFAASSLSLFAQSTEPIKAFDLQEVEVLSGPFKHAEQLNRHYLLELDADRLLAPYLREAGLPEKKESYGNWENSGLDGHIGGHYLSALSIMYAASGDEEIKSRLDYVMTELKRCQDALGTGYIGGVPGSHELWNEIQEGKINAGGFDLNKRWVPLYNIHKVYTGLRDAHLLASHPDAKGMLTKMMDWTWELVDGLSEAQMQDMLRSEHGGLNEVFADAARITGNNRYMQLARRFSHQAILDPLLLKEDQLTGLHANTQIPKVIGFKRIADVEGSTAWDDAARFFWDNVVEKRTVVIGGNSAYEHFHPIHDFSNMIRGVEGPETCNTYNMMKLSTQLFQSTESVRYMDFYERALYNHILSTQHPEHGGLVYFTPMRPAHYRVYSQPHTSFWCCVGSGLENHGKYGEMIYAHRDDELFVNLYIPSRLVWKSAGISIEQHTLFPEEEGTTLVINPKKRKKFTLKLRYPEWVKTGAYKVSVNGVPYPVTETPGSYVSLTRKWRKGDVVRVEFDMHTSVEQMPDKSNYYAFLYGPIVLAAKTDTMNMTGLLADDSRGGHIAHGPIVPMRDVPIVVGEADNLYQLLKSNHDQNRLRFTLKDLYPSKKGVGGMELVPFYQIHDSRYIIYWPQATSQEAVAMQEQLAAEEQEIIRLDALTLDRVNSGQQQPESDHGIAYDNSVTGAHEGKHWREAKGWFSYRLINPNSEGRYVYVEYCDIDKDRKFDILADDEVIATVTLGGTTVGDGFTSTLYKLPDTLIKKTSLTLRFQAHENSHTAKVVSVRLLQGTIE